MSETKTQVLADREAVRLKSVDVRYDIEFDHSPIVDALTGYRVQIRVVDVTVTEFPGSAVDAPFARARGYAVKKNGERDYRYGAPIPASVEVNQAYLAAHLLGVLR